MERRTIWMSFSDDTSFLGVCVIDVDEADAAFAATELAARFPGVQHEPGAEWTVAAVKKSHERGCNPGGGLLAIDVTADALAIPRNTLLSKAQLEAFGVQVARVDD